MADTDYVWVGTDAGNEGDLDTAANWNPVGNPGDTDRVWFRDSSQDVTAGFDQSAVAWAELHFDQSYTGTIDDWLQCFAEEIWIGRHYGTGTPAGSGRIKLDVQATPSGKSAPEIHVENSAVNSSDANQQPVRLKLADADTVVYVRKGRVGIATEDPGDTSTLGEVDISYVSNQDSDADVVIGPGVTMATLDKTGGKCRLACAATSVKNTAGELITEGQGAIGTLQTTGGTTIPNSTGAITTCRAYGGLTDFTRSNAPRAVGTVDLQVPGQVKYDPDVITVTTFSPGEKMSVQASAA